MICAGESEKQTPCIGDSGGPLMLQDVQIGIASFSSRKGCGADGSPAVFSNLADATARNWIKEKTGI